MKDICSECGDLKNLNARGVCQNRHGCEHRQYQHKVRTERLLAEMDRQSQYRHPSQNRWVDHWLHQPEEWGE